MSDKRRVRGGFWRQVGVRVREKSRPAGLQVADKRQSLWHFDSAVRDWARVSPAVARTVKHVDRG